MGIGVIILEIVAPILEILAPFMPGTIFPSFFKMEMFQRALIAALLVTIVAGLLGVFLLIQNLALIGDGLAHVSFGGVAVGVVLGATSPLWYALVFSVIAAITAMLALGMVILRIWGEGLTVEIESYLFGNLLLIDKEDLDMIALICIVSMILLLSIRSALLACTLDPLAARIQGLPVRGIGLLFSIITAAVVVSMVQVVGTLLVTALLVTPAATAQLIGRSFRSCLIWTQIFGFISVLGGLYLSSELKTGSGSMIALFSAIVFFIVILSRSASNLIYQSNEN